MNIYKTNFPTEQEGKDYLLSIGVLVETDNEIVFSKDTAAVVYIGKVVKIPATYDADGNIITPAVYYRWLCYRCNEQFRFRLWRFYGIPNRGST